MSPQGFGGQVALVVVLGFEPLSLNFESLRSFGDSADLRCTPITCNRCGPSLLSVPSFTPSLAVVVVLSRRSTHSLCSEARAFQALSF